MSGFYATIARYYDAENTDKTDDIDFYRELAGEYGGPLLDVGCGTGRVMFPLAAADYEVHGIDNEAAMLQRAEKLRDSSYSAYANKLHFHQADVRVHDFPESLRFALTLVPYNGLMHFHDQETQLGVLRRLHKWTRADGLLVLDLPNAGEVFATQDSEAVTLERSFMEPENGHLVMQQSVSYLDRTAQLLDVTWIYDEITGDGVVHRTVAPLRLYYYFYNELRLLLSAAGFSVEAVYGDLEYGPYEDGSERMVVTARPS